ncbi:MAG: NAD(P)-dependent oxidoreductase, partial [Lachnospiraceae bacterium]|nr:NAD(P)-dependent oxidoreductase [Lachnospiraceae bacterium]
MKILVTGANGYLGKGVVKELLDRGLNVIATDLRDDYIDKRANVICVDLFEIDNPYKFFGKPDVLVHMAWRDGFMHDSDNHIGDLPRHFEFIRNMMECTDANEVTDRAIKKIVAMGSMHEIGFFEGSIKEDTPCNPLSKYGISKNALRRLVELECKKNNVLFQWLRGFYIVGNSIDGS